MTFLDTDLVIQDQKGPAPGADRPARHRRAGLEGTVCAGLQAENAVIATGGSVFMSRRPWPISGKSVPSST